MSLVTVDAVAMATASLRSIRSASRTVVQAMMDTVVDAKGSDWGKDRAKRQFTLPSTGRTVTMRRVSVFDPYSMAGSADALVVTYDGIDAVNPPQLFGRKRASERLNEFVTNRDEVLDCIRSLG
jgi:hypothetical protein